MQYSNIPVLAMLALGGLVSAELEKRQINNLSCPGVLNIQSSSTVCCVGGSLSLASLQLSSCAGWPICTGPVTVTPSSTPANPPLTCATVINANNPNYSSLISAASASIAASGTRAITTINPTGSAAAPGSTATGTTASASGSSSRASASGASATPTSSNIAAATGMPGGVKGFAAVAGAIGMAGLLL